MPDETEKDWMSYCMADPEMNAEHPDKSERATVCHAHFDKAMMKGAETGVASRPIQPMVRRLMASGCGCFWLG